MRFVDSNIWLYAMIQSSDAARRSKAIATIQQPDLVVSTQVVNEVCYNLIRKASFDSSRISQVIEAFYHRALVLPVDRISMEKAAALRDRYSLGFWDSQLLACALLAGCRQFESEDLQDGLLIDGVLNIHNPLI